MTRQEWHLDVDADGDQRLGDSMDREGAPGEAVQHQSTDGAATTM